jgi:hypothetical protein
LDKLTAIRPAAKAARAPARVDPSRYPGDRAPHHSDVSNRIIANGTPARVRWVRKVIAANRGSRHGAPGSRLKAKHIVAAPRWPARLPHAECGPNFLIAPAIAVLPVGVAALVVFPFFLERPIWGNDLVEELHDQRDGFKALIEIAGLFVSPRLARRFHLERINGVSYWFPWRAQRGAPTFLRSDNGPEVVSKALLSWIVAQGIATALIEPGKRKRKSDR